MAKGKLFEAWTFKQMMPKPFEDSAYEATLKLNWSDFEVDFEVTLKLLWSWLWSDFEVDFEVTLKYSWSNSKREN